MDTSLKTASFHSFGDITINGSPIASTLQSPIAEFSPTVTSTPNLSPITPSPMTSLAIHQSFTDLSTKNGASVVPDAVSSYPQQLANTTTPFVTETTDQKLDAVLSTNGYKYVRKISDTLQGAIYKAVITDPHKRSKYKVKHVVIKQTSKVRHRQKEAEQDGLMVIVEENILKEASILKYLTWHNTPYPRHIAQFMEFFECDEYFYLVMEYVGDYNLFEFAEKCHQLIVEKKLSLKNYKSVIKFVFWQISVMIHHMHHNMRICHLDLCLENIVVRDGAFIMHKNGNVTLHPNIAVKIADFGLAEIFDPFCSTFNVAKWGLRNCFATTAPEVYAESVFDGMKSDIWSAGAMLYQLLAGQKLYTLPDQDTDAVFCSVNRNELEMYIQQNGLNKYFSTKSLQLMISMLNVDETKRICALDVLQSPWYAPYYRQYAARIEKKSKLQKDRLKTHRHQMQSLPYYHL